MGAVLGAGWSGMRTAGAQVSTPAMEGSIGVDFAEVYRNSPLFQCALAPPRLAAPHAAQLAPPPGRAQPSEHGECCGVAASMRLSAKSWA